jgi:6-pyruvoyltetrahydropterin/6-carboxytetrahydropterin synthase
MNITETFAIAIAHHLPTFPAGHKCLNIHGHLIEITVTVKVDNGAKGYAFDHAELEEVAGDILGELDHRPLNGLSIACPNCGTTVKTAGVDGLDDGLAETLLAWLVERFGEAVRGRLGAELVEVHVDEWSSGRTFRLVKHRKSWVR